MREFYFHGGNLKKVSRKEGLEAGPGMYNCQLAHRTVERSSPDSSSLFRPMGRLVHWKLSLKLNFGFSGFHFVFVFATLGIELGQVETANKILKYHCFSTIKLLSLSWSEIIINKLYSTSLSLRRRY